MVKKKRPTRKPGTKRRKRPKPAAKPRQRPEPPSNPASDVPRPRRREKEIAAGQTPPGKQSTDLPIRPSPFVPKTVNNLAGGQLTFRAHGSSAGSEPTTVVTAPSEAALEITPEPIPIIPTVYPEHPTGPVIVQNFVTINIRSADFRRFEQTIDELLSGIRGSNEMSLELRNQLRAEISAGEEILTAPKVERNLVEVLLIRPLKWIAEKAGSAIVSDLAHRALELLSKLMGFS